MFIDIGFRTPTQNSKQILELFNRKFYVGFMKYFMELFKRIFLFAVREYIADMGTEQQFVLFEVLLKVDKYCGWGIYWRVIGIMYGWHLYFYINLWCYYYYYWNKFTTFKVVEATFMIPYCSLTFNIKRLFHLDNNNTIFTLSSSLNTSSTIIISILHFEIIAHINY